MQKGYSSKNTANCHNEMRKKIKTNLTARACSKIKIKSLIFLCSTDLKLLRQRGFKKYIYILKLVISVRTVKKRKAMPQLTVIPRLIFVAKIP